MSGESKYETRCPSCQTIVGVPMDYSGKVRCPKCTFIWQPKNNVTTFYVQKPRRMFAMTLGETIGYGMSMVPVVVMTILISAGIGWLGLEFFAMSSTANEPAIAICFGISFIAISTIVFVSLIFGIGVRVVAEGVMVGNIATDNYRDKEDNLTIPDSLNRQDSEQLMPQEQSAEAISEDLEIQSES